MAGEVATGPGGAAAAGIGSIASQFAEGYRQARQQAFQQQMSQQDAMFRQAQGLMEASDHVPDPVMAQTMRSHAASIWQNMPPVPGQKGGKNQNTFGSLPHAIGSFLGIGGSPSGQGGAPGTPAAATPPQLPTPPLPSSAPKLSDDSQTFGTPGGMAPYASVLPPIPPPTQTTAGAELAAGAGSPAGAPSPVATPSATVSPVAAKPTPAPSAPAAVQTPVGPMVPPSATPAAAPSQIGAAPGSSIVNGADGQPIPMHPPSDDFNLPSSNQLVNHYLTATRSGTDPNTGQPFTAKYGTPQSDALAQRGAQMEAQMHAQAALDAVDQMTRQNPGRFSTLQQAEDDTEHGADIRHVMTTVGDYENAGLLPKGTLENWQKQRFADVRFGSEKYDAQRAFTPGSMKQVPGQPGKYEQIGMTDAQKLDAAWGKGYGTPNDTTSPEEKQMIEGHLAQQKANALAGKPMTSDELAVADLRAKAAKEPNLSGPAHKALSAYTTANAPAIYTLGTGVNAQGQTVHYVMNGRDGGLHDTNIPVAPGGTFNVAEYMDNKEGDDGMFVKPDPTLPGTKISTPGVNAGKLIAGYLANNRGVGVNTLNYFINDPTSSMNDTERAKLKAWVGKNVSNPF